MKKLSILLVLWLAALVLPAQQMLHKTLPNGLEVVIKENFTNNSVAVHCFLRTGSINEEEYIGMGLSHVLEHVVSGGSTQFHTEKEYEDMGKQMGSIVNAATTYNMVDYFIQVDKQYANDAVKDLMEHVAYTKLDSLEMARELKVIEKEVVMRSTPPMAKIMQRAQEIFYTGTPYSYPVIGYTEKLRDITHDIVADYYKRRHSPENMVVVVCGNFVAEDMMATVEKEFGNLPRRGRAPLTLTQPILREGESRVVEEFDTKQPIMLVNYQLDPSATLDKTALEAALDCLMQRSNSPITKRLVEDEKLCAYAVGSLSEMPGFNSPAISMIFVADSTANFPRIMSIVDEELAKAARKGISKDDLERIVSTEKAHQMLRTPGADDEAMSIGWNLVNGGLDPDDSEKTLKLYESLTVDQVNQAIKKYLLSKNRVIFMAVPTGQAKLLEQAGQNSVTKSEITKTVISPTLTLLHRQNTQKPMVQCVLWFPISNLYENRADKGIIEYTGDLLLSGAQGDDPHDIRQWKEDRSIRLSFSSNRYGSTFSFRCLKEDLPRLKDLLKKSLAKPGFAKSEIDQARQGLISSYKFSMSDDGNCHQEFMDGLMFPTGRRGLGIEDYTERMMKLNADSLNSVYSKYFKAGKAMVTLFGDLDKDEATGLAKELANYMPKGAPAGKSVDETPVLDGQMHVNNYDFEPVNVNVVYPAPKKDDPDFAALEVLSCLLNGRGLDGRLYMAVRGDTNNLAYFAQADYDWSNNWGIFNIMSQTSADKKDALLAAVNKVITDLQTTPATSEEISTALSAHKKMLQAYFTDNEMPGIINYYELSGLGWDYLQNGIDNLEKVTPEQVQAAAVKYLKNPTVFVSEPTDKVKKLVD